jgi:opacity protein-like surface antigen
MKKIIPSAIIVFYLLAPALAYPDPSLNSSAWTGNLNLFFGFKYLDEIEWEPTDDQVEYGIEFDFRRHTWPINIAIDFLSGSDDGEAQGIKFESKTSELNLGVRKTWEGLGPLHTFVGGGFSVIWGEFSGRGLTERDKALGWWFNGGVYWTLTEHFNIGLEGRFSTSDVTLFGIDVDPGGAHIGVVSGFHW